jgi:hypothetical protein
LGPWRSGCRARLVDTDGKRWKITEKLVGGDWNMIFIFHFIYGNVIIPADEVIFFRGVGIPPTRHGFLWIFEEKRCSERKEHDIGRRE